MRACLGGASIVLLMHARICTCTCILACLQHWQTIKQQSGNYLEETDQGI